MDSEQLLLNLYKQQQYDVTRTRLQKAFMAVTAISGAVGITISSIFYTNWLYDYLFSGMVLCVLFNMALVWRKRMRIDTASLFTTLYAAFIFVPVLWLMTGITGIAPFLSLIVLVAIITLFSGKRLTWLLAGYQVMLLGFTVYSALIEFSKTDNAASLVYLVAAFAMTVILIVLYMMTKQKEYNELNDKFLRSSFKDELTQLYNRKLLDLILEHQELLFKRENTDYMLMMFDVDNFKRLNDEHGHIFGDIVLRSVAKCISEKARASDFVVRYGGDEFLVIQAEASQGSVDAMVERIDAAMEGACQLDIPVSFSYGFALRSRCASPEEVLKLADERLYEKKQEKKVGRS